VLKDLKIKSASGNTQGVTTGGSLTDTSMAYSQNDLFSQKSTDNFASFGQKVQTQNLDRQSLSSGAQTLSQLS
jgi:hypothetical protein